jgi:hypothetical protein
VNAGRQTERNNSPAGVGRTQVEFRVGSCSEQNLFGLGSTCQKAGSFELVGAFVQAATGLVLGEQSDGNTFRSLALSGKASNGPLQADCGRTRLSCVAKTSDQSIPKFPRLAASAG